DDERGSGVAASVGVKLSVRLGPVAVALDGPSVGADALWSLKDANRAPNLGVVHLDGLGLRAPTGAALAVDAALVQGAGYLKLDPARHQYGGAVQLTVRGRFGIEVVGLLTTRMPDGSDG